MKTPPLRNLGGRLTLGEVEKIAPSAIWRLDISSHSTRSGFSHSLGHKRTDATACFADGHSENFAVPKKRLSIVGSGRVTAQNVRLVMSQVRDTLVSGARAHTQVSSVGR